MKKYKLKDLLEIKNGKDHKNLSSGKYPVYGSGGIMRYVDKYLYDKPSILLPRKGTLTNIQFIDKPFWTVDTAYYTEVKEDLANIYYLYCYLSLLDLQSLNSGTGVPSMTFDSYYNIEIFLPPLSEQKRIAKVLSDIDAKIALNKKINQELEAMAKEIYDYWFIQFDYPAADGKPYKTSGGKMHWNEILKRPIPANWEVKKLGEIAEVITKGTTPSTLGFDFTDVGINFVKVECIENGQIVYNNLMHISQEANQKLKRSQLQENDILITIAGRLASACVVPHTILPANTNQAVGIARLKKEYLNFVQFLYFHINSPLIQNKLKNTGTQSIQKNLTLPDLGNIIFPIPLENNIINNFNNIIETIQKQIVDLNFQNTHLEKLRNELLPLLMNGQVAVEQYG